MSWQTQNWAGEQRGVSPQAKLILIGLASCSDANHCAYPSVGWLIEWSGLERKTVLKWLAAMSDTQGGTVTPLIEDTGQRKGRSLQIKVWRLKVGGAEGTGAAGDPPALEQPKKTVPKTGQSQKREHPKSGDRASQKRDTEPYSEPIPLSTDKSVDVPPSEFEPDLGDEGEAAGERKSDQVAGAVGDQGGKPIKAHTLPDGWEPPAVDDLQPEARGLVKQWPSGAYQVMCANFANYWRDTGTRNRKKSDWLATLCNWLIRVHSEVKRAEKAGVSYAVAAPTPAPVKPAPILPVTAKKRECEKSKSIHRWLRTAVGDVSYAHWIGNCAIIPDEPGVVVVVPSSFIGEWLEQNFKAKIVQATASITGSLPRWVRFDVEKNTSQSKGAEHHG
jgi:DnaA N-terminal domain/Helix-turn-helix domain